MILRALVRAIAFVIRLNCTSAEIKLHFDGHSTICRLHFLMESIVDRKQTVGSLLAKANQYRNYAQSVGDWETAERILVLTEELKQWAQDRIRERAREIWEENGRPAGRDLEFWLQAEREFREAEDLAKDSG
jgi:Protein of unknown function (DUF2934)